LPFNKPSDAIVRVLLKVGANPADRIDEFDQDPEYTACRSEELPLYYQLYAHGALDTSEREVLCCFMLEGLNDFCSEGIAHPLQGAIFDALIDAGDLHAEELAYWSDTSDPDSENWWPITQPLLAHRALRANQHR
jgi:hypothetical protein